MVRRFKREDFFIEAGPFTGELCGRRVTTNVYFEASESGDLPQRFYRMIVQIDAHFCDISPGYLLEQKEMDDVLGALRGGECPRKLIGKYSPSL